MADKITIIREDFWTCIRANYPDGLPDDLRDKVQIEMDKAASIDALKGKGTALDDLHKIWKDADGRTGDTNHSNSWIAYAVGLTNMMPTGATLEERRVFARAGLPDVDSDFEDERREEVIDYMKATHGLDRVSNVGTFSIIHYRSAFRDIAKTFDVGGGFFKGRDEFKKANRIKIDEIMTTIPKPKGAKTWYVSPVTGEKHEIDSLQKAYDVIPEFAAAIKPWPDILKHAKVIEGLCGDASTHASGILVSSVPLEEIAPVIPVEKKRWDGDKVQSFSTQYPYEDCESIGLIKFDVLSLKLLSVVKHCLRMIKEHYGRDIDIENLPLDDVNTYRLYQSGNLAGVFQCESSGMQETCRKIGTSCFEDIMAAVALYRPGPMKNIDRYAARKRGDEKIDYFHPTIEPFVKPILAKTFGICVYQEQIMQICNALAGMTITDGYGMIKAVGKKQLDLMTSYEGRFIAGCVKNGVPREVAQKYWTDFIIPFSDYGFNAAHSCCYAYNSYITAYFKANFPEEFFTASLNVEAQRKKWEKVLKMERDLYRNEITLLDRDKEGINRCKFHYEIVDRKRNGSRGKIRPALLCQGLTWAAAEEVEKKQPFKDMRDFAKRTASSVDSKSVECFGLSGFFGRGKGQRAVIDFTAFRNDLKKTASRGESDDDMYEEE
jgi:DNA polymerase-3 subunit alpha